MKRYLLNRTNRINHLRIEYILSDWNLVYDQLLSSITISIRFDWSDLRVNVNTIVPSTDYLKIILYQKKREKNREIYLSIFEKEI